MSAVDVDLFQFIQFLQQQATAGKKKKLWFPVGLQLFFSFRQFFISFSLAYQKSKSSQREEKVSPWTVQTT